MTKDKIDPKALQDALEIIGKPDYYAPFAVAEARAIVLQAAKAYLTLAPVSGEMAEAIEREIQISRDQIALIEERAKGDFLDKKPMLLSIYSRKKRMESTLTRYAALTDGGKE